jgi:hypothetical protein
VSRPRPEGTPVILAYVTFALIGVSAGVTGVLLVDQMRDYAVDRATIGIIFFAKSAGFVLAGATAGALIHRFGTRVALVLGAGCFALAALYTATRPPFAAFVLVQVLVGYGIGALESVLNAYLAALANATTLLNRLHAFFGVGALLGPPLATWIVGGTSWPAAFDDLRVLQHPRCAGERPEVTLPAAEHDRDHVEVHLVDQTGRQRLPADLAGRHRHVVVVGERAGLFDGAGDAVGDEGERRAGEVPIGRRLVGDHEDVLAHRRDTVPAVGDVEQAPADHGRANVTRERADVVGAHGVTRKTRSGSAMVTATSPLPYQSNSGPTASLSSAMNPSTDTTAAMITLPMTLTSYVLCSASAA